MLVCAHTGINSVVVIVSKILLLWPVTCSHYQRTNICDFIHVTPHINHVLNMGRDFLSFDMEQMSKRRINGSKCFQGCPMTF